MASMLSISEIWRYPVKSMGGERLERANITIRGIEFDRGWAVRDERVGAIRSARYLPRLLMCSARYLAGTDAGLVPHAEITLPDGSTVNSDDSQVHRRLSDALGSKLTLWSLKPANEIEHLRLGPGAFVTGDMISEMRLLFGLEDDEPLPDMSKFPPGLLEELVELATPRGTYFDAFPIDIITTSSLRYLQKFLPGVNLDVRRFRPNIVLDDGQTGAELREAEWAGRRIRVGSAEFDIVMECPRCTIIAAAQQGGIERNPAITRAIVREMNQKISVYGNVHRPGIVAIGDALRL